MKRLAVKENLIVDAVSYDLIMKNKLHLIDNALILSNKSKHQLKVEIYSGMEEGNHQHTQDATQSNQPTEQRPPGITRAHPSLHCRLVRLSFHSSCRSLRSGQRPPTSTAGSPGLVRRSQRPAASAAPSARRSDDGPTVRRRTPLSSSPPQAQIVPTSGGRRRRRRRRREALASEVWP